MRIKNNPKFGFLLLPLLVASLGASSAYAGPSRCFMGGTLVNSPTDKGALKDILKLHMEADTKKKCEEIMAAYCKYNVLEKDFATEMVHGLWKPDIDKPEETTYTFNKKCKIIANKEDD